MSLLLLVDDAAEIGALVRLLARRSGQEIVFQPDGANALVWLRSSPRRPDLLLLDLHLPGEGGIEVFKNLQTAGVLAAVPAALFTQGASGADIAAALDAGIPFLVSKELLSQPEAWKDRIAEIIELAAGAVGKGNVGRTRLDPLRLVEGLYRALAHPGLARLEDAGLQALWRRASMRIGGEGLISQDPVDVALSSATLATYLTPLVANRPEFAHRLIDSLAYQVECLFGRTSAKPVRAALMSALIGAALT